MKSFRSISFSFLIRVVCEELGATGFRRIEGL